MSAVLDGLPQFPLATLRSSSFPMGFVLGELRRGIMPGSAGATTELKLAMAAHLARTMLEARRRASSDSTVVSLQVQVDDFIASASGPSPVVVIAALRGFWFEFVAALRREVGLVFSCGKSFVLDTGPHLLRRQCSLLGTHAGAPAA